MTAHIITWCIAGIIVAASALYYRRRFGPKGPWLLLCSVRCAMVLLLLGAFFEPVFKLKTLSIGPRPIAVLIDASQSMSLFKPDSLIRTIVSQLNDAMPVNGRALPRITAYAFGDSLRQCTDSLPAHFSDGRSIFPSLSENKELHRSGSLIIISDGNWTNQTPPASALREKNCWYVTLPHFSPHPFLHAQCADFPSAAVQDSPLAANIRIRGYKNGAGPVEIRVREKGHTVGSALCKTAAGYFGDTVCVKIPSSTPGRHCFTVDIINESDSLRRRLYLVGSVCAAQFSAAIQSASPNIDKRFISLALADAPEWEFDEKNVRRDVDALFILEWNDAARRAVSRIKPSGTAVFLGCAPCQAAPLPSLDSLVLTAVQPDDTLARNFQRLKLPTPSLVDAARCPGLTLAAPLLTCEAIQSISGKPKNVRIPFLFSAYFSGTSALFLCAHDIWKMEFLPLAVEGENETPSFIRYFLSSVRRILFANINRSFFAYPASEVLSDQDSCVLFFDLPPPAPSSPQTTHAPAIHLTVSGGATMALDTTFAVQCRDNRPVPSVQSIRFKPLPSGAYSYTAVYTSGISRLVSSDTLYVQTNDAEIEIQGQNTIMLDQMALAAGPQDIKEIIAKILDNRRTEKTETRDKALTVEQSWPLLLAIVCLLALEWTIRRKTGLDG